MLLLFIQSFFILILSIFYFPLLHAEEASAFLPGKMTQESPLILKGRVEKIQNWKGRQDLKVVTLKPTEILKGPSSFAPVKILEQKYFQNAPSLFNVQEPVLVFLKPLPSYTAWQDLIREGVKYEIAGKNQGIIRDTQEQKQVSQFVIQELALLKNSSPELLQKNLKDFYLRTLKENPSQPLKEGLAAELATGTYTSLLQSEDLRFLANLVADPQFPTLAKISLTHLFVKLNPLLANSYLENFFCLPPAEVCLLSAETLESRKLPPSIQKYSEALQSASPDLKVGLLTILGRHQRKEACFLFEKYLSSEKEEKTAAAMIEALGTLGGSSAQILALRYAKDPRYYVRLSVVKSMGNFKNEKGFSVLETALKTQDPAMVAVAAQSLQQIGTPTALKLLGKYYEKGHHGHWEPSEGHQHFMPKQK